jgi:hypothetical protein
VHKQKSHLLNHHNVIQLRSMLMEHFTVRGKLSRTFRGLLDVGLCCLLISLCLMYFCTASSRDFKSMLILHAVWKSKKGFVSSHHYRCNNQKKAGLFTIVRMLASCTCNTFMKNSAGFWASTPFSRNECNV